MEEELKVTRLKLYLGQLLPIDPKKLEGLDLSMMNLNRNQMYLYDKEDIHKEIFTHILLTAGKIMNKRPTFGLVTLNNLIDEHFNTENPVNTSKYVKKDMLFIIYTTVNLTNKIWGPILDKIIEERKAFGKSTFVYCKGNLTKAKELKSQSIDDYIDLNNGNNKTNKKRNEVF